MATYEASDFQMKMIERSLGQLCADLCLEDSVRYSYRENLNQMTNTSLKMTYLGTI